MSRKRAAALKYEKGYSSPVVTAIGYGDIAEKIIQKAHESNIPLIENEELVNNLCKLSVGQDIPSELYQAVAEIIAYI
jgi:flagellar biosynthesis protein